MNVIKMNEEYCNLLLDYRDDLIAFVKNEGGKYKYTEFKEPWVNYRGETICVHSIEANGDETIAKVSYLWTSNQKEFSISLENLSGDALMEIINNIF
jgi:hypothetical protein